MLKVMSHSQSNKRRLFTLEIAIVPVPLYSVLVYAYSGHGLDCTMVSHFQCLDCLYIGARKEFG